MAALAAPVALMALVTQTILCCVRANGQTQTAPETAKPLQQKDPQWFYGGFLDAAYLLDFNHPANDLFRSRGTAYKVDGPILNMAAAYLRKTASDSSRPAYRTVIWNRLSGSWDWTSSSQS